MSVRNRAGDGQVGRQSSNLEDLSVAFQRQRLRCSGGWPPNQEGRCLNVHAGQGVKRIGLEQACESAVFGCKADFDRGRLGPGDPARHVIVKHRAGGPVPIPGAPEFRDGSSEDRRIAVTAIRLAAAARRRSSVAQVSIRRLAPRSEGSTRSASARSASAASLRSSLQFASARRTKQWAAGGGPTRQRRSAYLNAAGKVLSGQRLCGQALERDM